jgi:hypothetical protein
MERIALEVAALMGTLLPMLAAAATIPAPDGPAPLAAKVGRVHVEIATYVQSGDGNGDLQGSNVGPPMLIRCPAPGGCTITTDAMVGAWGGGGAFNHGSVTPCVIVDGKSMEPACPEQYFDFGNYESSTAAFNRAHATIAPGEHWVQLQAVVVGAFMGAWQLEVRVLKP